MALRVLSGLIWANPSVVPQGGGFARITFNPFELADGTDGVELKKVKALGEDGSFSSRPATIVSARQFIHGGGRGTLGINDTVSASEMTVRWRGAGAGSVHEEIPFLVIGEVPSPAEDTGEVITIRVPNVRVRDRVRELLGEFDLAPEPSFGPGRRGKKGGPKSSPKPRRRRSPAR